MISPLEEAIPGLDIKGLFSISGFKFKIRF
jgi:hypothetical protein